MSKLSRGFASLVIFANCVFASGGTSTEDFFYQRGYEVGFSNGFERVLSRQWQNLKKC